MCGSLASAGCAPTGATEGRLRATLQYHAARAAAYSMLGFAAGLLSAVLVARWLTDKGPVLGVGFGALMALYAVQELWRSAKGAGSRRSGRLSAIGQRAHRWAASLPFPRPVTMGLATALLPCGFLFAALLQAALLAHPVVSALGMLLFALASSPALLAAAGIMAAVRRWAPRGAPVAVALVLLASSGVVIWRSISPPHDHSHHDHHDHQMHEPADQP